MSDPVFEAVTRAVAFGDYSQTAAAREALKPVRAKHYPVGYTNRQRCCVSCFNNIGKPMLWPCDTAKLIYTTEELNHDR